MHALCFLNIERNLTNAAIMSKRQSDQERPFVPVNGHNHLFHLSPHTLRHTSFAPPLNISNSTLQRTRQISMKQRSRQPMHNRHPMSPSICLTRAKFPTKILTNITPTARTSGVMARNRVGFIRTRLFYILCSLPL